MKATGFERPAATLFAVVALAAIIAAFAIGQARAQQTVNPVPPPPPPTFNPSTPNTVPQAPYVPVAPTTPSGLGSTPAAPGTPAIESPQTLNHARGQARPAARLRLRLRLRPQPHPRSAPAPTPSPAAAAATPAPSRMHAGHHRGVRHRWSRRHGRYHFTRVLGPAYYPGLGEFDPPYPNPCHFRQEWSGYLRGRVEFTYPGLFLVSAPQ